LRELTQSDPTIEVVEMDCPKSYKNLTINYFMSGAGRGSVEKEFFKKTESKLVEEVIDLINSILTQKPNEPILVWTFKEKDKKERRERKNKSIEKVIKERLQEKNPDLDLEVLNAEGNKILNFQTFGNELGLNSLTHCKHSLFVGLLYLPRERVAGMLKGLSRDMGRNVYEKGLLEEAITAEQASYSQLWCIENQAATCC
jgi:hypothetical protein